MVIEMESGKRIDDDFGAFREEVLYAQWLPPLGLDLGLQEGRQAAAPQRSVDVEAFLRTIYLSQE